MNTLAQLPNPTKTVADFLNLPNRQHKQIIFVKGKIKNIDKKPQGDTFDLVDEENSSIKIKCILFPQDKNFNKSHELIQNTDGSYSYFAYNAPLLQFCEGSVVLVEGMIQTEINQLAIQNFNQAEVAIKEQKIGVITTPKSAALNDIQHILKGIVEIKEFLINFNNLNEDTATICKKHCEKIREAADDNEISHILFCCGGWDEKQGKPNWVAAFDEDELIQTIKYAQRQKQKTFITGLGHAQYNRQQEKTRADDAAEIDATTPTMAAIEAACLLLFGKTWAEYMTSQKPNFPR